MRKFLPLAALVLSFIFSTPAFAKPVEASVTTKLADSPPAFLLSPEGKIERQGASNDRSVRFDRIKVWPNVIHLSPDSPDLYEYFLVDHDGGKSYYQLTGIPDGVYRLKMVSDSAVRAQVDVHYFPLKFSSSKRFRISLSTSYRGTVTLNSFGRLTAVSLSSKLFNNVSFYLERANETAVNTDWRTIVTDGGVGSFKLFKSEANMAREGYIEAGKGQVANCNYPQLAFLLNGYNLPSDAANFSVPKCGVVSSSGMYCGINPGDHGSPERDRCK